MEDKDKDDSTGWVVEVVETATKKAVRVTMPGSKYIAEQLRGGMEGTVNDGFTLRVVREAS